MLSFFATLMINSSVDSLLQSPFVPIAQSEIEEFLITLSILDAEVDIVILLKVYAARKDYDKLESTASLD
ncbi:hypothetical protein MFRU_001g02420 [Monilinia fructicola]|nr:hypothetical protein MFRU_001g02420 [Monilinia fructicola]